VLALVSLAGLTLLEKHFPMEPFEAYYGGNHLSAFARSGIDTVSELMTHGLMESDPEVADRLRSVEASACRPATKPPHIILVHDESSFDIRMAPGINLPSGYGSHFLSFDGKERRFLVDSAGTRNTTCLPASPRARSGASRISLRGSPPAASSAACPMPCGAAAIARSHYIPRWARL
jgi:hypothetical protein